MGRLINITKRELAEISDRIDDDELQAWVLRMAHFPGNSVVYVDSRRVERYRKQIAENENVSRQHGGRVESLVDLGEDSPVEGSPSPGPDGSDPLDESLGESDGSADDGLPTLQDASGRQEDID